MTTKSILIIDDDPAYRQIASIALLDQGYDVWEASCTHEAYQKLKCESFDLVLCDLHMPFKSGGPDGNVMLSSEVGLKTAKELHLAFPNTEVVVLSAYSQRDLSRISKSLGPVRAFSKPTSISDLVSLVVNDIGLERKVKTVYPLH